MNGEDKKINTHTQIGFKSDFKRFLSSRMFQSKPSRP